jgi:hypothetical protein
MDRRIDVFFYGLFMDAETLRGQGVTPSHPRRACVEGFALRIGRRATLVPASGARAWGMLLAVTHADLARLYGTPGLEPYRPEPVLARPLDGAPVPALCYTLPEPPGPDERNADYATRLQSVLRGLDFPADYVAAVGRG